MSAFSCVVLFSVLGICFCHLGCFLATGAHLRRQLHLEAQNHEKIKKVNNLWTSFWGPFERLEA